MKKKILFISCGDKKIKETKAKAKDLYIGGLYKLGLEFALEYVKDEVKYTKNPSLYNQLEDIYGLKPYGEYDEVFIVSGLYGIVPLDRLIKNYDVYLPETSAEYKKKWTKKVKNQLNRLKLKPKTNTFVSICSTTYNNLLLGAGIKNLQQPLGKLPLGMRMKWLNDRTEAIK